MVSERFPGFVGSYGACHCTTTASRRTKWS